jgi:hypothetical protein
MKPLIKKIFVLLSPLILVTICYLITDPTQKLPFYKPHAFDILMLSRGDISTRVYLMNVDKYKYDSFIFGSSRTTAHTSKAWGKYLSKNNVAYSFSAWNESIVGIYKRLKLIDSLKKPINNAFLLLDIDRAFEKGAITWDYYLITGTSKYNYYMNDYINYLQSPRLILTSVDYQLFHKKRAYMEGFMGLQKDDWNPVNNDWEPNSEKKINADSVGYYKNSSTLFYSRPAAQQFSSKRINATNANYLHKIMGLLKKHHAKYKIVIAPLYDQIKLNPQDHITLNNIFGIDNVYDYSGVNAITNNMYNYNADVVHYRKKVGDLIFKEIYQVAPEGTLSAAAVHYPAKY